MKTTTIKDQPILLPDGKQVKVGMTIFEVQTKCISSYKERNVIKKWSGASRAMLIPYKVIGVNTASTARTFTLQSDKGCEHTFSVRDTCIQSKLFSSKASAIKEMKAIDQEDVRTIKANINRRRENLAKEIAKMDKTMKAINVASRKHK